MHAGASAGPARFASVSELYSRDEVELLLEEIRELEPTSCRGEDPADCEIAGSGAAAAPQPTGARSPAPTERSWDSHAQYSRAPPPAPLPLAPLYCHLSHLLTADGALTTILVVCSLGVCVAAWSLTGWVRARGPLGSRLGVLCAGALSSFVLHATLLLLHVGRLAELLPLHWAAVRAALAAVAAILLLSGALATALTLDHTYTVNTRTHLYTASGLGAAGGLAALALAALALRRALCRPQYRALPLTAPRLPSEPL